MIFCFLNNGKVSTPTSRQRVVCSTFATASALETRSLVRPALHSAKPRRPVSRAAASTAGPVSASRRWCGVLRGAASAPQCGASSRPMTALFRRSAPDLRLYRPTIAIRCFYSSNYREASVIPAEKNDDSKKSQAEPWNNKNLEHHDQTGFLAQF